MGQGFWFREYHLRIKDRIALNDAFEKVAKNTVNTSVVKENNEDKVDDGIDVLKEERTAQG